MTNTRLWIFLLGLGLAAGICLAGWPPAQAAETRSYVGSDTCKECHDEQFASYKAHSKKARSFQSVVKMRKGLTADELQKCYECHTTGHNQPGGFRSMAETPTMANLGCEACHGPGSAHAASEDASMIKGKLTVKDCERCHNSERIESFSYSPLVYGGGH